MSLLDIFELAFSTLWVNKFRTLLTILGVSIGIGAIVFLVSLGYGLRNLTISKITSIKALTTLDATSGNSAVLQIKNETISQIKQIPDVLDVLGNFTLSGQAQLGETVTDITVNAVPAKYLELEDIRMVTGTLFKDSENKLIISAATAQALAFASNNDAVGKKLKIKMFVPVYGSQTGLIGAKPELTPKEADYEIGGVFQETESSLVYLTLDTVDGADAVYSTIKIEAKNREVVNGIRKNIEDNFGLTVTTVADTIHEIDRIFNITQIVLFGLGAIGLLVASVGMFNTMTVSLLERIREIGIMKALGATSADVWRLFVTESTLMGFCGGFGGIALGYLGGKLANTVINLLARSAGGEPEKIFATPLYFVLIIMGVSLLVGVLTGFYPARRGSKINPLEALRYE